MRRDNPCTVILFPMPARVGRIREVAAKYLEKPTERAADYYQQQVTDALLASLSRIGIPDCDQGGHVGAFWNEVVIEIERQKRRGGQRG